MGFSVTRVLHNSLGLTYKTAVKLTDSSRTMSLSKFDGLELPASADFHVHLRDGGTYLPEIPISPTSHDA